MAALGQGNKIGLLGGSFNPAHAGHVYISEKALELLGLDEIWWLVSPQNPLKPEKGMAEFQVRFARAKEVAATNPKIIVSDFETTAGTSYTFDTLTKLKKSYPQDKFIWLMGADNLLQFPKWYKWQEIIAMVPIAVFNRGDDKEAALLGEVATKFADYKVSFIELVDSHAPAWTFLDIKTHPASATKIREVSSYMAD